MKNLFLTLIFCFFAALNPTMAQNVDNLPADKAPEIRDPCAKFAQIRPKVKLRSSYGRLQYNYDYDSENLDIMAARNNLKEEGMFTAGLSLVDVDWSVSLNTISRSVDGDICVIPASVDVFIGYRNPIIYISNDLDKKSCRYQMVMRHEHQHQQINVSVLEYYLPIIKKELEKSLDILTVRAASDDEDPDIITDDMNSNYAEVVRPLVNRLQITLQIEQQRLDNRENYQYETELCND